MTEEPHRQAVDPTWDRTITGLGAVLDRITPWLLDLGNWIFGGLIAVNLLILGSLMTIGPVDNAVIVATAALALALPPDVAGFLLLRLAADMKNVDLEQVATTAFVEAGFTTEGKTGEANSSAAAERKRARAVLSYSYTLLTLTVLLTLVGITAALWHMAWWIAVLFAVMGVISQAAVLGAFRSTGSSPRWRAPSRAAQPKK